jgi:hypothetical protein
MLDASVILQIMQYQLQDFQTTLSSQIWIHGNQYYNKQEIIQDIYQI